MIARLLSLSPAAWGLIALAVLALLGAAGRGLYQLGWDTRDAQCQASTATTTAQRSGVALDAVQAISTAKDQSFIQLARAAHVYDQSRTADAVDAAAADAAGAGLLDAIEATVAAASGCGVPAGAAAERASQANRALAAALAACDAEQRRVAADLAQSLRRGLRCQAEHEAAQALTQPHHLITAPDGAKEH